MSQGREKRRGVISLGIRYLLTLARAAKTRRFPVGLFRLLRPWQSQSTPDAKLACGDIVRAGVYGQLEAMLDGRGRMISERVR